MHKVKGCALLGLIISCAVHAGTTADDFPNLKAYAKSLSATPIGAINSFNPGTHFNNYNASPAETAHYSGVEAQNSNLNAAAANALNQDAGGRTIVENFGEQRLQINKKSAAIEHSKLIEDESYALTHGLSNDRVHCDETPVVCRTEYHDETCRASTQLPDQSCLNKLVVSTTADESHQSLQANLLIPTGFQGFITINLFTGSVTPALGALSKPLTLAHGCKTIRAKIERIVSSSAKSSISITQLPSCLNNGELVLSIRSAMVFESFFSAHVTLSVDAYSNTYLANEYWDNGCLGLDTKLRDGLCRVKESYCSDATKTRVIDGLSLTRDCWETNSIYACSTATTTDECRAQKDKGCLETGLRCVHMEKNLCTLYEHVYRCSEKICPAKMVCAKDVFCVDGDCTEHAATSNENFGKDVAALAAIGEIGHEFSQMKASLFAGHVARCKIWSLDVIDCCSDKGWGKDLNIAHCRDEDKALGRAKQNYLVHYIGEFCATKVLGECVEHKHTYCVFDSKMARIIQEEGRLAQLNSAALGSAESPTCAGLSIEELQQLDMGKIEFEKPVYPYQEGEPTKAAGIVGDLHPNFINSTKAMDEVSRRIQSKVGG